MKLNKAIFLDRDGTIIKEISGEIPETFGYVLSVEQVQLITGAAEAIAKLKEAGFKIIIITNQSAIARGWLTEEELEKINNRMYELLIKENQNAVIDDLFYSPYHSEGVIKEYSIEHETRKPNTGLIKLAEKKYDIDLKKSYMIGDSYTDMKTGVNAGLKNILVLTGYGKTAQIKCLDEKIKIDFIAESINEASEYICKNT